VSTERKNVVPGNLGRTVGFL